MTSSFDPQRPHNGLPPLPPAVDLETKAVLKKVVGARAALAELKALAAQLPSQAVLLQTLGLVEARLSSEIENIVTTHDVLYRALLDDGRSTDAATKEVLAYQKALWHGFDVVSREGRPIAPPLMEELVALIKGTNLGVRRLPGTRLARPDGSVIYTPPDGEPLLRQLLANLAGFLHDDSLDLDPLTRLAVMHYQFEAIHPFTDGNGRTGRILNILYLVEQGLLDVPVLYLSGYILEHKAGYYEGLQRVTVEGAWEPWILYILNAIEQTARQTLARIRAILDLIEQVRIRVQQHQPRVYSKDLVELIFRAPYTKVSFLEEAGLAQRVTATKYLRALVSLGVLEEHRIGKELYFLNLPFSRLLSGGEPPSPSNLVAP